jgi:hypothetical protein
MDIFMVFGDWVSDIWICCRWTSLTNDWEEIRWHSLRSRDRGFLSCHLWIRANFSQIVGVALQYVATSKGELLAGKMVNGVAIGGLLAVGTTYASEVESKISLASEISNISLKVAPTRLRGVFLGGLAFFVVAMQAIGLGVVRALVPDIRPSSFRTAFALQWIVGGLPIIAFVLVPE